jgi:NADH-quinone oxidoreductase subunit L
MHRYIWLVPLLPLAGAAINGLLGRKFRFSEKLIGGIAIGSVALAFLISVLAVWSYGFGGDARWPKPYLTSEDGAFKYTWIPGGATEITQGAPERARAAVGGEAATAVDPPGLGERAANDGRQNERTGRGSSLDVEWSYQLDPLSCIFMLIVTGVGLCIFVFATGYMHGDAGFYRFFAYLGLFMFSMLVLVMGSNFLMMFVGWEGVGLCSYLLIGYYFDRKEAGDASRKAFITNRIGDFGFTLAIFAIIATFGSVQYTDVFAQAASYPIELLGGWGLMSWIALGLFIGAIGKSAQIPLYVWLPDAMAGPTPVSALIHAATMVTAGLYMVTRTNVIFQHSQTMMLVMAIVGALTAIFAASIGITQNDIKKVLAYSTVSQLGFMFLACGVGAFVIGIFHVMTHAFFKALMFLGAGSVIHGMHHEQDMRRMGGLKKYMPITFATMLTGWLAISGIPIFAGFFSKDEILWKTWSTETLGVANAGKILWVVGAVTALLTAVYMTRLMVMTFWGKERFLEAHAGGQADEAHAHAYDEGEKPHDAALASAGDRPHHEPDEHADDAHDEHGSLPAASGHDAHGHGPFKPHESPWVMTVPLVVLAILSTFGGLIGVPYALSGGAIDNYFEHTLEPVIAHPVENGEAAHAEGAAEKSRTPSNEAESHGGASPESVGEGAQHEPARERAHSSEEVNQERLFSGISVLIALAGIGAGWALFRKRPLREMPRLLENKYYVDEVYNAALINPIKAGSREGLWQIFDVNVIDGIVNGLGRSIAEIGRTIRYLQVGFVRSYAAMILLGALAVIGYFTFVVFAR